ncbi:20643_t:CDS:2, partial [Gigaspora margarita]
MPCYADTIVKIKLVHQKESHGTNPMGHDNNEIELTIYVSIDSTECNPETQV